MTDQNRNEPMLWLVFAGILLSGCSNGSSEPSLDTDGDAVHSTDALSSSGLGLSTPGAIRLVRQVNRNALRPQVLLDGVNTIPMQRDGEERWSGSVQVEPNASYTLSILWIESVGGRDLPLAQYTTIFDAGDQGGSVTLASADYDVSLDLDADGFTNLEERRDETDPFVANGAAGEPIDPTVPVEPEVPGEVAEPSPDIDLDIPDNVTVLIPRVGAEGAPRIDGLGVELDSQGRLVGEWASAVQTRRDGQSLTIDNLMIDARAEGPNGAPYRRWAAMHDDDWLYILVLVDDDGSRQGDSFFHFDDDSLEFFIDGDNSKNRFWGDNDDFHFVIPMLPLNTDSKTSNTSAEGRFSRGVFSSNRSVDLDFVTGPGLGPDGIRRPRYEQDVYELRFGLKRAKIEDDQPFGIELQVNDDDNGLERDSKWGWFHPARGSVDIDFTVTNPSVMGTAILLP